MTFRLQKWKSLTEPFKGRTFASVLNAKWKVELFRTIQGSLFFAIHVRTFGPYRARSITRESVLTSLEA